MQSKTCFIYSGAPLVYTSPITKGALLYLENETGAAFFFN